MSTPTTGFMVIYRWRLNPGKEQQFLDCWTRNTPIIAERCGGLGSRLHRAEDGTWLATGNEELVRYALGHKVMPRLEVRRRPGWRTEAEGRRSAEAVAETFPRILLEPVADLLVPAKTAP